MDPNNPNSPNNPFPPAPPAEPPPYPQDIPPPPTPAVPTTPLDNWPPITPPANPQPQPAPTWPPTYQIPVNPQPQPQTEQPTSTFTQPQTSPLDNPWGAPTQAPAIDGSNQNQPSQPVYSTPQETAPTDLSHLISNNDTSQIQPSSAIPETLVVPQANSISPEVPTLPSEGHRGIPKWLIGVGVGLLLVIAGASAYFILGIGQNAKTTSLPVQTTPVKTAVRTPPPAATPVPQATPPAATDSASFGQLQGNSSTPQATSAADLLRQRQQQGR